MDKTQKPCNKILFLAGAAMVFFWAGATVSSARQIPGYTGYVNDTAGMISARARQKIERVLQSFDVSDSTQIAVLTIGSLEGDALEDFSIRTVEQWKIGQKGKDNGVLLLVVQKERKVRIEVGRGLEGVLTDLMAGRIIDGVINPRFKAGRFDEGFEAAVAALIQAVHGEFKGGGAERPGGRRPDRSPLAAYFLIGILIVAFLGNVSKPLGSISGAVLLPLLAFLGAGSALGILLLLFLVLLGALGGLVLPLILSGMFHGRRGGLFGGGGFGGSSGGGGFGGFGGGGFGGGGASGGW
ncbi:MAG: TPM domain-containing protein [Desulfobacterales bacterium]|nr:TPM domain-containing protein [Desulfobacterales bacterium]